MTGVKFSNVPNPNGGRGVVIFTEIRDHSQAAKYVGRSREETTLVKKMAFSLLNGEELSAWQRLHLALIR